MKYFDIRKNYLCMHNKEVSNQVEMDSDLIRNMTKGHPVIVCQECGEDIAWGNIRNHRRGVLVAVYIVYSTLMKVTISY